MSEPLCPTCGRVAKVWPSHIFDAERMMMCVDWSFHGFTLGDRGTAAKMYEGMRALAAQHQRVGCAPWPGEEGRT